MDKRKIVSELIAMLADGHIDVYELIAIFQLVFTSDDS